MGKSHASQYANFGSLPLFSHTSQPTANAVLSILRLSILASSDIETDFTSFSVYHIFSALIFTDFLSMILFISSSELNLYMK